MSTEPSYDIKGDGPADRSRVSANVDQVHGMLRALLTKELSLVVRHEKRPIDGYAMTVSSGSTKLKPSGNHPHEMMDEQLGLHLEARPVNVDVINVVSLKAPGSNP
ncbi:MAG: DUF3738 domain-containing protein [Pseudomonadota bacterium]